MKVLSGHYSTETAFLVPDYPYSFKLRCKIRYWLEVNSKGTRFWSQTTNPKRGDIWNAPKASTYSPIGVMIQHEGGEKDGHIGWVGLSMYDVSKAKEFLETYRAGLLPEQITLCEKLIVAHEKYEAAKAARQAAT